MDTYAQASSFDNEQYFFSAGLTRYKGSSEYSRPFMSFYQYFFVAAIMSVYGVDQAWICEHMLLLPALLYTIESRKISFICMV